VNAVVPNVAVPTLIPLLVQRKGLVLTTDEDLMNITRVAPLAFPQRFNNEAKDNMALPPVQN